ncbi:uncharacterized protein [Typha latifolia]|uniref:uncharacterized protein n=1 Tax=Typha latifolia TaxID=4733 RepID=UPI003C2AE81B
MPKGVSIFARIPHLVPHLARRRLPLFSSPPSRSRPRSPTADLAAETMSLASRLRMVRWVSLLVGCLNLGIIILGGCLLAFVVSSCPGGERLPFAVASMVAGVKIMSMIGAGMAQHATAEMIVRSPIESSIAVDAVVRHERRVRYKRWLWWTRFGMVVTVLQFFGALYLLYVILTDLTYKKGSACFPGQETANRAWKQILVIIFLVLVWLVVIIQSFTGSDILRWRSFYATHDSAWKAHYREVFDHGIREALCCLGRVKYLTVLEEDEVYSVARLLGDLVAYRASGTGHLELLAGLALLQRNGQLPTLQSKLVEAPKELIEEAAIFHPFAEAAYTGPLLDFGRNPILFPCAWLYRQGILCPWTRNRRPTLEGDNWWRGHAAAFLKYAGLQPEALLRGRVCQAKREVAYFVVVLHDQRSVIISVRGTETPEDLITDGLCRECALTEEDLNGLIRSEHLSASTRHRVISTFPHYGHGGIVESARELFLQIDGQLGDKENSASGTSGFLSSLLGVGGQCRGYRLRIVGHSLGAAVGTLLGLRLYGRYPNLHVYAYGPLPCLDLVIAEACSDFVTTIVYNDEFSARLSVNSILRLRSAAIASLSDDSLADSAMIQKLARRILHVNKYHEIGDSCNVSVPTFKPITLMEEDNNHIHNQHMIRENDRLNHNLCGEAPLFDNSDSESLKDGCYEYKEPNILGNDLYKYGNYQGARFELLDKIIPHEGQNSRSADASCREIPVEPPEMFLPGLIIHIVQQPRNNLPLWKCWCIQKENPLYKAFLAKRESFGDIFVAPYMFTDHLPWRCHYAMQKILEAQNSEDQHSSDSSIREHLV